MHGITSTFMAFLCTFLKAESLLVHGQTNGTSASNGHSDPDVYKQLLQLETDLSSIKKDQEQQAQKQTLLEEEIKSLRQWNQTAQIKISLLESENKNLKERLQNKNSSSTLLKQNLTTSEDLGKLENILKFEIEQTVRDSEEKIMKNVSATIKDLELRDRYLSLSLLDVHSNMSILDYTLSKLKQQQKTNEEQQNMIIQNLTFSLLDVHNNTAGLSTSFFSLGTQQKQMKSEIQMRTNSQQNDITKLNDTINHLKNCSVENHAYVKPEKSNQTVVIVALDAQKQQMKSEIQALTKSQQNEITQLNNTIIHFKNRVQSNVAFTAGILGETNGQHTYASGDIVKFPKFIYQVGGGYNPTTGVFTAPKTGLYIIFCTNVAAHQQSASNLVVHQLQVGDRVWIQVYDGGHLYSNIPDTTLSVVMINGSD
ncbi:uncharacterized protein LOC134244708 [Saccostrea cucullata]|uniref:uncharacterized protein LOC134244708 n=1 Tax=Saccostrea cuccullata TaxID=36930 RepID=UPI002ECFC8DB